MFAKIAQVAALILICVFIMFYAVILGSSSRAIIVSTASAAAVADSNGAIIAGETVTQDNSSWSIATIAGALCLFLGLGGITYAGMLIVDDLMHE